jgi:hypothetical protein
MLINAIGFLVLSVISGSASYAAHGEIGNVACAHFVVSVVFSVGDTISKKLDRY